MVYFSITFNDQSKVAGMAIKVICNQKDVTNLSKNDMMKIFIDGNNKIEIQTQFFKVDFLVNDIQGFTI